MSCFGSCTCICTDSSEQFDAVMSEETKFGFSLEQITKSNIGWFNDKTVTDHHLSLWELQQESGLYILWHKEDYCDKHERFHMRGLYVGKGKVNARLRSHWAQKDFSEELLVYFSFFACSNRQAKYLEQLFLDLYNLPNNVAENKGVLPFCQHWRQEDVD